MQYEVWGKSRESKVYEFIDKFLDEREKYFMLDIVDPEVYSEAIIIRTEWQQPPSCVIYKELEKPLENKKGMSL